MIHLIYIYFIINSFLVGVYLSDQFNDDSLLKKQLFSLVLFLFGGILALLDLIFPKILNCFEYVATEIRFQYRMYFTDYFDKIYLDDTYSEICKNRQEKLKRVEELVKNSSKQIVRHSKQIQKKYGSKRL